MKRIFRLFLISIIILGALPVIAGDMTGIGARALLSRNNINLDQLTANGQQLLIGDLTGVGKSVKLNKIKLYLTQTEVIQSDRIDFIQVRSNERFFSYVDNHGDFKFNDIVNIKLNNKSLKKEVIQGLIIAK